MRPNFFTFFFCSHNAPHRVTGVETKGVLVQVLDSVIHLWIGLIHWCLKLRLAPSHPVNIPTGCFQICCIRTPTVKGLTSDRPTPAIQKAEKLTQSCSSVWALLLALSGRCKTLAFVSMGRIKSVRTLPSLPFWLRFIFRNSCAAKKKVRQPNHDPQMQLPTPSATSMTSVSVSTVLPQNWVLLDKLGKTHKNNFF